MSAELHQAIHHFVVWGIFIVGIRDLFRHGDFFLNGGNEQGSVPNANELYRIEEITMLGLQKFLQIFGLQKFLVLHLSTSFDQENSSTGCAKHIDPRNHLI